MSLKSFYEERLHKWTLCDFGLYKTSLLAFALMIASLWPAITSVEWYWYGAVFIITIIKPLYRFFTNS